jgi:predicted permease
MSALSQDLRFALRALRRRRAFTAIATITIALGIGAATAIYSIVDGVLLRPLPFREPNRVVAIWQTFPEWRKEPILAARWDHIALAMPEYRDLRDQARSFTAVAAWTTGRERLVEDDRTELVRTLHTSATMLDVLGARPLLGRMFLPGEDVPNAGGVALVSYEQWQTRYGGDRQVLGRVVHLEDRPYTIIGVLPPRLAIGRTSPRDGPAPAFWIPLGQTTGSDYDERTNHSYFAIARLRPGVTMERAVQDAATVLDAHVDRRREGTRLVEWQTDQTRDARAPLLVLLGAVGLLLLAACANVATLLLGEATTREAEIAARLALGARRRRIVRQLLTESLLLALSGGALGGMLGWAGTRLLVALAPPRMPGIADVAMDARVLLAALVAVVGTGLLFGLAPALTLARAELGSVFRATSGQSAAGRGALQRALVAAELALSVVLLVGAGLLARSFDKLTAVDPGFRPAGLLVVQTALPEAVTHDSVAVHRIYANAVATLAALPGVTAASASSQPPFSGGASSSSYAIEGEVATGTPLRHQAQQRTVMPDVFTTLGIPLLAGRALTDADRGGAPNVVVVSEALARRDFPGGSPIGRRVKYQGAWRTIVGVVGDVRFQRLTKEVEATIYAPFAQRQDWGLSLLVRTTGDAARLAPNVRRALAGAEPELTLTDVDAMPTLMQRSYAEERYRTMLISLFGVLAALLAAVGMYGVTSRAVARRTREAGIRLALGATAWSVVRQHVGFTLSGVGIGVALGLGAAALAGRALTPFLFGVTAGDPLTYAAIVLLLAVVSVAASIGPARRASRVDIARTLGTGG